MYISYYSSVLLPLILFSILVNRYFTMYTILSKIIVAAVVILSNTNLFNNIDLSIECFFFFSPVCSSYNRDAAIDGNDNTVMIISLLNVYFFLLILARVFVRKPNNSHTKYLTDSLEIYLININFSTIILFYSIGFAIESQIIRKSFRNMRYLTTLN